MPTHSGKTCHDDEAEDDERSRRYQADLEQMVFRKEMRSDKVARETNDTNGKSRDHAARPCVSCGRPAAPADVPG